MSLGGVQGVMYPRPEISTETERRTKRFTGRRPDNGLSSGVRTMVRRSSTGGMLPTFRSRATTMETARLMLQCFVRRPVSGSCSVQRMVRWSQDGGSQETNRSKPTMTETTRTISLSTVRRTATGTSSGVRTAVHRSSTGEIRPTFRYRVTTTATARTTRPSTGTTPGSSSNRPPEYLSPTGGLQGIYLYRLNISREFLVFANQRCPLDP